MTGVKKIQWLTAGTSLLFLWLAKPAIGAELTLGNVPPQLTVEESFTVDVSYTTTGDGPYYLRPAFFVSGSTQYFGCILVGTDWICGAHADNRTVFYEISLPDTDIWTGSVTVKADGGDGEYNFKIMCYTASGGDCADRDSDPAAVTIIPLPSTTPTPVLTPTPALTPTLVLTPTPTITPTFVPTTSPTPTLSEKTGTCLIREAKDQDGKPLSQAKIYLDGNYLHHYTPEALTFCPGCKDQEASLGFGTHILRVEQSGYGVWEVSFSIESEGYREFSPVLTGRVQPTMVPTSKPTPTPTPTPVPTPSLTPTPTLSSALSPVLLAQESPSLTAAVEEEGPTPAVLGIKTPDFAPPANWVGLTLVGAGALFLGLAAFFGRKNHLF